MNVSEIRSRSDILRHDFDLNGFVTIPGFVGGVDHAERCTENVAAKREYQRQLDESLAAPEKI